VSQLPTYVLDISAVLRIPSLFGEQEKLNACLNSLTEHTENGRVVFPDQIVSDCRRIAAGEDITVWLRAIAGSRRCSTFPYEHQTNILAVCQDLLDQDSMQEEQSPVMVAAMGDYLATMGHSFEIVTEDRFELPTRMNLVDACKLLGFQSCKTKAFLKRLGPAL
jgi:hypothetical protein